MNASETLSPASASPRPALVPLAAMFAMQTLGSMAGMAVPVFAVALAGDLGISAGWLGLYMTAVFTVAMFSGVMGGGIVMRLGAIRVAQISLVIAATALTLMTVGAVAAVVAAALMIGCAYGPPTPASSHILARVTPPRFMPLVFSIKQTGVPAGGALAGALVPPMVLAWGWRGAAWAVAAACVVAALALQPLRARLDADRDRTRRIGHDLAGPLRLVMSDPAMRRMAFLAGAFSAVQMSMVAFLVTFLVEHMGLDLVAAGAVLAAAQVTGVGARIFWGMVSGALISARRLLFGLGLVMAAAAAALAVLVAGTPLWILYGVAMLFGASAIGWNGVMLAELARIAPPGLAGVATGGSVFVTFAGVAFAPALISGFLAVGAGWSAGFALLAALALTGATLAYRHRT